MAKNVPVDQLESQSPAAVSAMRNLFGANVKASGDTSGASDLAKINALLNAGMVVSLDPGSTYYVNGTIRLPSGACLSAYGATVHLTVGSTNILQTASVAPSRQVADAATTANAATVTSATAAFTQADVGSTIGVVGAGYLGSTWYAKVVSVQSSSQATLSSIAMTTVSNASLSVFAAADRCKNVSVLGGTWILDVAPVDGHNAASTAFNSFASCFRRCDGLVLRDTTWSVPGAAGQGGKFTVSLADVTNFVVDGTCFTHTAGDGVHVSGPASYGSILNTYGTTGDDQVVLSLGDGNTPYITDTEGNLAHIVTRGIICNGSWSAFKLYDLGFGSSPFQRFKATGIQVDDITGTTQVQAVSIFQAFGDEVTVSRLRVAPGGSMPMVDVNAGSLPFTGGLTVRDVVWTSASPASNGVVRVNQPRGPIRLQNVSFAQAPAGTNIILQVVGTVSGSSFGPSVLDVNGVYVPKAVYGSQVTMGTLHVINASSTTGTADVPVSVKNVYAQTTSGVLVNKTSGFVTSRIDVSNVNFSGAALFASPAGDSATKLVLSQVKFNGTNLVVAQSPLNISLVAVEANTTGALVAATNAGATPIRVVAIGDFTQAGSGVAVSRTGTQSISVSGAAFPVDLSILTPTDQDVVSNSNAALSCGAGTAIYHSGGTGNGWKNIYTGATY